MADQSQSNQPSDQPEETTEHALGPRDNPDSLPIHRNEELLRLQKVAYHLRLEAKEAGIQIRDIGFSDHHPQMETSRGADITEIARPRLEDQDIAMVGIGLEANRHFSQFPDGTIHKDTQIQLKAMFKIGNALMLAHGLVAIFSKLIPRAKLAIGIKAGRLKINAEGSTEIGDHEESADDSQATGPPADTEADPPAIVIKPETVRLGLQVPEVTVEQTDPPSSDRD